MSKHLLARICAATAIGALLFVGTAGCAATVHTRAKPVVVKPAPRVIVKPARKVWVPGHWTYRHGHRHWVPGHYRT